MIVYAVFVNNKLEGLYETLDYAELCAPSNARIEEQIVLAPYSKFIRSFDPRNPNVLTF